MISAAAKDHVWVSGPDAAGGCADAYGLYYHPKIMQMSMVFAITRNHTDVHGLCYHLRSCGCLWAVLPHGAMLISLVCLWFVLLPDILLMLMDWVAAGICIGIHGPCYPGGHVDVLGLCCP